ncbi:hypothetical protein DITRI_Ditri17bG0005200 [Diplodiscus trichospermus]
MAALKLVCALVLCMLVVEPMATRAITCGDVARQLSGCITYLQNGGKVPSSCCNGIRNLNNQARTRAQRQAVCRCLQSAARSAAFKTNLAEGLPGKCGVRIPYTISRSINCNNVR